MVVLTLGDIVGDSGCDYLEKRLPKLVKEYGADIVIANGENASEGNGILPTTAEHLRNSGVDVITLGNHGLRRREIYPLLEKGDGIIRPGNYHPDAPGSGVYYYDNLRMKLCVINLQGSIYMQSYENPFAAIDRLLKDIHTPNIVVDFHTEATSEIRCMGEYLNGKVSAVVGTHTHVPTADGTVLSKGTGYITDLGMCGSKNSVLGVETGAALYRMQTQLPTRFSTERDNIAMSGAAITIDESTGRCEKFLPFAFV